MSSLIIFFLVINSFSAFTFLKVEKKKKINEKEIKKELIKEIVSLEDWRIFSRMEDIIYRKDFEKFLYGFSKNKVYKTGKKEPINLYFRIKSLELLEGKKDFYLLAIGDKEFALLDKNLELLYYKEFKQKIERYFLADRNFDGGEELYLIFNDKISCFSEEERKLYEHTNGLSNFIWFANNKDLYLFLFPDSLVLLEKDGKTKKIFSLKNEKFILCAPQKKGLTIISLIENRSISAYTHNNKIEIFGTFDSVSGEVLKEGYLIKADDNLFFINKALTYYEKINEFYPIKRIKDYRILDLNGDGKKDLVINNGEYSYYFLNNLSTLEEMQKDYYSRLINRIKNENLYNYQDLLITLLNLSAIVNLPFDEINQKIEKMIKKYYVAKVQRKLLLSSFLSVFFVLLIVLVVRPFFYRLRSKKWRIENRPLPQLCKIVEDLVALNHNYLLKGNFVGAQNAIKKIIEEFKLVEEEFFYLKTTLESKFFTENYLAILKKLLNNKNIRNLREIIKEISHNLSQKIVFLNIKNFEINQFLEKEGYYFLEIYDPFSSEENLDYQIFLDNKLINFLTHLIIDHFHYAQKKAVITLEKKIITDWQRKVVLTFYSDAETSVNLKNGHLAEEIREIKEDYCDYLQITLGKRTEEKLLVIFSDLIGIIEGIIKKTKISL
uniref:Uncharacterized protein n=1 Tax=candidate division WOR-3 bacterium TaxID=2052148 RepID=A0A7V4E2Q3_UNCW3